MHVFALNWQLLTKDSYKLENTSDRTKLGHENYGMTTRNITHFTYIQWNRVAKA